MRKQATIGRLIPYTGTCHLLMTTKLEHNQGLGLALTIFDSNKRLLPNFIDPIFTGDDVRITHLSPSNLFHPVKANACSKPIVHAQNATGKLNKKSFELLDDVRETSAFAPVKFTLEQV